MNPFSATRRRRGSILGAVLIAVLIAASTTSCVEPTFARVNPYDPDAEFEMRIGGAPDTVHVAGTVISLYLDAHPAVTGYNVTWSTSHPGLVGNQFNGIFGVGSIPASPTTVTFTARIGILVADTTVVLAP